MCVRFVERTGRFAKRGLRDRLGWVYGGSRTNGRIWHYEDRATGKPARELQIGKRDRRMTTSRMPKRVISIMLAAVLAITLIPSEALPEAYAAPASDAAASDGASAPSDGAAQKAQDAPDAAGGTPDAQDASDADADIERPASVVSATERIADDAPAKPSVEMTRASVNLSAGEDAPYAVFSQGPLSFQVNADDPASAAVVGVDAHTDATDLVIPAEVVLSGEVYPVTRMIGGGGSVL